MQRTRIEKHESLIHQVINEYLIKKGKGFLKNEFITIMGIKLSADLSIALIFISVLNHLYIYKYFLDFEMSYTIL